MILLITALVLFTLSWFVYIKAKKEAPAHKNLHEDWDALRWFCIVVGLICSVILFIWSFNAWSSQISDIEDVVRFENVGEIYAEKADALTNQFAGYLAQMYPEHEREVFSDISPENVSTYLALYPEIRSSETLLALVEKINQLQSDVYDQKIKIEELNKNIRYRQRNPWIINFLIPSE